MGLIFNINLFSLNLCYNYLYLIISGLFSSNNSAKSSPGSVRSIASYRCPNPRLESASENELNSGQSKRYLNSRFY